MEVARGKLAVNLSCDLFQDPLGSIDARRCHVDLGVSINFYWASEASPTLASQREIFYVCIYIYFIGVGTGGARGACAPPPNILGGRAWPTQ